MNLAPRIYVDATQAVVDGTHQRIQRDTIETERRHRNASQLDAEALHEAEDDIVRLHRENRALRKRLAEQAASAASTLRTLLDRSEAFSRSMTYLRQTWARHLPDNEPYKKNLLPLVNQNMEVDAADDNWQRERETCIETVLKPKAHLHDAVG